MLDQEARRHTYSLGVCYPGGRCHASSASGQQQKNGDASSESISDHGKRELDVLHNTVDSDAFNDGIDLMPPPGTVVRVPLLSLWAYMTLCLTCAFFTDVHVLESEW